MKRWLLWLAPCLFAQPACESCEWSYGSIAVTGMLTVLGASPADLQVRLCTSPHATECEPAYVSPGAPTSPRTTTPAPSIFSFDGGIPSEGFWSCSFDKHWLVITGTGCEETAINVTTSDGPQMLDANLYCK